MAEGTEKATYPATQRSGEPTDFSAHHTEELDSPASQAFAITPGADDLPVTTRGLYIGNSGNVFCRMATGNTTAYRANVFFHGVVGGTILPVRVDAVYVYNEEGPGDTSQNTTATFLVGLY